MVSAHYQAGMQTFSIH